MNGNKLNVIKVVVSGAGIAVLALGVRYGLLESGILPRECGSFAELWSSATPVMCGFKWALVQSFLEQRLGWLSLVCGVLAFGLSSRRLAWAGWLTGVLGLVFYNYEGAAVGGLLALLVLCRPVSAGKASAMPVSSQPIA